MNGHTSDLIASLSSDVRPVVPVSLTSVRLGQWAGIGGAALAVAIVVGLRRDWRMVLASWPVLWHTVILALVAGSGAWAALRLATPGEARRRAVLWPMALAAVWLALVGIELVFSSASVSAWVIGFGWRCIVRAMAGAAVPGAVLLWLVRRSLPLAATPVAVALAASTAAAGELAAEWMCPNTRAMHLIVWHAVPFVVAIVAAAVCANTLMGQIAKRPWRPLTGR